MKEFKQNVDAMRKHTISLSIVALFCTMALCGCSTAERESITPNLKAITSDLSLLAAKAQQFYHTPVDHGGGGSSFEGLTADEAGISTLASKNFWDNKNGRYSILTAGNAQQVVILCVGKVAFSDGSFPRYTCTVSPRGFKISKPR